MTVPYDPTTGIWYGVKSDKGGYMRLEDFCNSGLHGSELRYTSGILFMEEELLGVELGWRVCDWICQKSIDGWDALLDLQLEEDEKRWAAEKQES